MPRYKSDLHDWPSLNAWLFSIGVTERQIRKNFYYSALVDYFPGAKNGSHKVPTKSQIEKERKRLAETINNFNPDIVVPIGKLSISYCLNKRFNKLGGVIGKVYVVNPYNLFGRKLKVIPLPHPSGASTWLHNLANIKLFEKALELLRDYLS